jgi:hypothetical protein
MWSGGDILFWDEKTLHWWKSFTVDGGKVIGREG